MGRLGEDLSRVRIFGQHSKNDEIRPRRDDNELVLQPALFDQHLKQKANRSTKRHGYETISSYENCNVRG